VIDEVLAVGDEQFQAKCLDRIRTFQEEGRTILFVSHNADQIRAICDRAVVLDNGLMLTDASPNEAVRVFREHLGESAVPDDLGAPNRQLRAVKNVEILGVDVVDGAKLQSGSPLHLRVGLKTKEPIAAGLVIEIHKHNGELVVRTDPDSADAQIEIPPGECVITADMDRFDVVDGAYQVNVGIVGPNGTTIFDWMECAAAIEVTFEGKTSGTLALAPRVAVEPRPWY
jgi:ABC-2 type transport system ATP-binding protein